MLHRLGIIAAAAQLVAGGAEPTPSPIAPTATSQPLSAVYSLRKIVSGYAGNCLQVRNSANTLASIGFDGNGDVDTAALAAHAALGDGTTLTVATWYDQSGNGRNFTSTARPILTLGMLTNAAGKAMPGIDFTSKSLNMTTAATFLDVGGTANLGIAVVAGTYGWSSAGTHARSPAVYSSASGAMLGYGTTSGGILAYGAQLGLGETNLYGQYGQMFLEDGTPTTGRIRNLWWNQTGANVAGGSDTRKHWTGRAHGIASATGQRLVLGNRGDVGQSHNGPIFEVLVWQNASALTDNEVWAVSQSQRSYWGALGVANFPVRYQMIGSGQSLMQYMDTVASASTGLTADTAAKRVFAPSIQSLADFTTHPNYELTWSFSNTAIGGSSVIMTAGSLTPDAGGGTSWAAWNGVDATNKFWWDQYNNIPGPCLVSWVAQVASYYGAKYNRSAIIWDQGQAEAIALASPFDGTVTLANWVLYTKSVWAYMRTTLGNANIPIIVQPLGRQTGQDANMRAMRLQQAQMAIDVANVYLTADDHDLTRQDTVHLGAGPADPNGFDVAAVRIARAALARWDSSIKYSGPYVASATKGSTTVDVTLAWPSTGDGTDFTPTSGIVGWNITDGSGARTISSAVRQSASVVRLTVSGGALSGTVSVWYDPQQSALDRTLMVVDDQSRPLQPSDVITAT